MGLYGDPEELDRLAGVLREQAALVRASVVDHRRTAQSAPWMSVSADAYRAVMGKEVGRVETAAEHLDDAADALFRHAEVVRERLAMIARAEEAVRDWLEAHWQSAQRLAAEMAGTLVEFVDPLVRRFVENPWAGLPFDPFALPPTGEAGWLGVHASLVNWDG